MIMEAGNAKNIWKLVLAYDGTDFYGWQVQPGRRTVQGELSSAIARITGEHVLPQGSGRTDAGVHAFAQVASFPLAAPIPAANFSRALNRTLPPAIRVLEAQQMPNTFHARHSARQKTYEYRIYRGGLCSPWLARYVYSFQAPLNIEEMQHAALQVLGEHDFTSFATSRPDESARSSATATATKDEPGDRGNLRTIYESLWMCQPASPGLAGPDVSRTGSPPFWNGSADASLLVYRVRGNGFLHRMVRNLVGTFLQVGLGNLPAEEIPEILATKMRAMAGPTAPPQGLFLVSVDY